MLGSIRNKHAYKAPARQPPSVLLGTQRIGLLIVDAYQHVHYACDIANILCAGALKVGTSIDNVLRPIETARAPEAVATPQNYVVCSEDDAVTLHVALHQIVLPTTSHQIYLVSETKPSNAIMIDIQQLGSFLADPAYGGACMIVSLDDDTIIQATDAALNAIARHRDVMLGTKYASLLDPNGVTRDPVIPLGSTVSRQDTIMVPNGENLTSEIRRQRISIGGLALSLRTFIDPSLTKNHEHGRGHSGPTNLTMQRFAGGIAHELNNVLTVLVAAFEELREYADDPSVVYEIADEIETATARAKSMSHRLLSISGRDSSLHDSIQIAERVEHCVKGLRTSISPKFSLSAFLDTANACIEMDRLRFDQIIEILVSNACDAMPDGGPILIDVAIHEDPNIEQSAAVISVSDTGHGIRPQVIPHIFDRFFTTRLDGMNAGLGLDTAKEFVESVNGTIFVANSTPAGTTISVRLPCTKTAKPVINEPMSDRSMIENGHLVVVVDDEDAVRKYVSRCLEREGYRVLSARDGQEGFELVSHYHEQNQRVSAVVSDMLMPRMGGPEMARKLSEICPHIPFLFISGYTNERVPESISSETAFLHKPFAHAALATTLARLIKRHQSPAPLVRQSLSGVPSTT